MQKIIDYFKCYGIDANTTATIFITLFTFSVGLIITWFAGQLKTFKEKKSYKKSVLFILNDFSKTCERQVKVVTTSLNKAGLKNGNDFIIDYVPFGTLEYLSKIDFNIFIKNFEPSFYKKNYSKAVSKLFSIIAQAKTQHNDLINQTKTFFEEYKKSELIFNNNVERLRQIHDSLRVQLNDKPVIPGNESQLIISYFKIFENWFDNGAKNDFESIHNEIIKPILEENKKFQNVPLILETNTLALNADYAFMNIEKIDNFMIKRCKDYIHFHRRAYRLTNVITKILK